MKVLKTSLITGVNIMLLALSALITGMFSYLGKCVGYVIWEKHKARNQAKLKQMAEEYGVDPKDLAKQA